LVSPVLFVAAPLSAASIESASPGKGWNTLLRLYGPLESWFDKTWRPGEIEPM
jgi:hypothetical protein